MLGHFNGAQTAIAYAARNPERVSQLTLRDPLALNADVYQEFPGQLILEAMRPLAEQQWELISLNIAHLGFGFADSEVARGVRRCSPVGNNGGDMGGDGGSLRRDRRDGTSRGR